MSFDPVTPLAVTNGITLIVGMTVTGMAFHYRREFVEWRKLAKFGEEVLIASEAYSDRLSDEIIAHRAKEAKRQAQRVTAARLSGVEYASEAMRTSSPN